MRIDKILNVFLIFALIGVALHAFAGTQMWDFEKDAKGWEVANGNWSVVDGVYKVAKGGAAEHSIVGEDHWDDYTVEAKIRIDQSSWAGVIFRAQNEFEYYVYYLNTPDNKAELWKHKQGAFNIRENIAQIPAKNVKIANGEWLNVKVVVDGNKFTLFIDDVEQAAHNDAAYKKGKIGVWVWQTEASFDDVKVTGDNVKGTLAVEPRRKLTTVWGKIKRAD